MPINLVRPLTSTAATVVDTAGGVLLSGDGLSAWGMVGLQSCVLEPIEADGWRASFHV
jgi:hypothetical protein